MRGRFSTSLLARNTEFRRFWSASTISSVGSGVSKVALPLIAVTVLHSSALMVAVISACGWAPWLIIGFPAGAIASQVALRELQMVLQLLQAVFIASVPVAHLLGVLSAAQMAVVAFLMCSASVLFGVGNAAALPTLVPDDDLEAANSLTSATSAVVQLGGPGLGGLLVELVGAPIAVFTDAASYLVSAVLLWRVPRQPPVHNRTTRSLITDGYRLMLSDPLLRVGVTIATAYNFQIGSLNALFALQLVRVLHQPASIIGVMYAVEGAGSLIGAALATKLGREFGSARVVVAVAVVVPISTLLLGLGDGVIGAFIFAVGAFLGSAATVISGIHVSAYRQRVVPREALPRVLAAARVISWGIVPIGAVFGGVMAEVIGIRDAMFATAAAATLAPIVTFSSRLRNLRDLPRLQLADT